MMPTPKPLPPPRGHRPCTCRTRRDGRRARDQRYQHRRQCSRTAWRRTWRRRRRWSVRRCASSQPCERQARHEGCSWSMRWGWQRRRRPEWRQQRAWWSSLRVREEGKVMKERGGKSGLSFPRDRIKDGAGGRRKRKRSMVGRRGEKNEQREGHIYESLNEWDLPK